ncbi:MAG: 50S ribosomal protein L11 methyltransferase [Lachnospiraceae bacterium]|nr:50S ribosomal protein L11 methyltransferase [Lachnospiraceae bacterium]
MKWKQYTLETTTAAAEALSALLWDAGIEGVQIEDAVPLTAEEIREMFIDIPPEMPPDDGSARVSFYLEEDAEAEKILPSLSASLKAFRHSFEAEMGPGAAGTLTVCSGETEDKDWINNWKKYFRSFSVGGLTILPAWEAAEKGLGPAPGRIIMDPGSAFGSGTHETTRLCLSAMQRYLRPGMRVLDVGTGSGILSLGALRLGASFALGTELDPAAVITAEENRKRNGFDPSQFSVVPGNVIDDPGVQATVGEAAYDFAVANIFAPVIILLSREIGRHLRPGTVLVTSGILEKQVGQVEEAFRGNPEWELLGTDRDGEWCAVIVRKR